MTRIVRWFFVALLVAAAGYLVYRAVALRIDYWDSYLYMNNARCMLGDSAARYQLDKPPVLPALYMPIVAITDEPASVTQYVIPHFMAIALSMASIFTVWLLLRRNLPPLLALAAVVFCVGNRIFIHYAAYSLADIASLGFVTLAFVTWFKARDQRLWRWFVLTGVFIALTVGTRYQNALFPIGIGLAEVAIAIRARQVPDRRFLGFGVACVVGLVLWLVIHKLTYDAIGRPFSAKSLLDALEYAGAGAERQYEREAPWQYFRMLPIAVSPIVLVLAIAGLVVATFQRLDRDWLFFVFLIFVGGPLFRVDHNEIRYLYAAFPALLYFAMRPFEVLPRWSVVRKLLDDRRGVAGLGALAMAVTLVALVPAFDQVRRDQDRFFTTDVFRSSSAWLLEHRQQGAELVWYGRPHTLHPPNPMQFEDDEYYNIFHYWAHILEFFAREKVEDRYWRGQSPEQVIAGEGDSPIALFYGAPDDLHAWEVKLVDRPFEPIHAYTSHVWPLAKTSDGFAGNGVTLRRASRGYLSDTDLGEVQLIVTEPNRRDLGTMRVEPARPIENIPDDATAIRLVRIETEAFGVPGFMEPAPTQ